MFNDRRVGQGSSPFDLYRNYILDDFFCNYNLF